MYQITIREKSYINSATSSAIVTFELSKDDWEELEELQEWKTF